MSAKVTAARILMRIFNHGEDWFNEHLILKLVD